MEQKIPCTSRCTSCWLDEKNVVVISMDSAGDKGHCELLNTVSVILSVVCPEPSLIEGAFANDTYKATFFVFLTTRESAIRL